MKQDKIIVPFFILLSLLWLGCSSQVGRQDGLKQMTASKHTLGERLFIPSVEDIREGPSDLVISRFAHSLAARLRSLDKASAGERFSFLSELQECLQLKEIPTVQALCYLEAKQLAKEFPAHSMTEEAMLLHLSDRALALAQQYDAI